MLDALRARLRALVRRNRIESEIDAELRFHVEMATQANRAAGMTPEEARRVALRDLGGVIQTKQIVREARATRVQTMIRVLGDDAVLALRTMRRSPGFVVVAAIVLALGFAITGTVFSTVNGMLSDRAAIPNADRLVYISPTEHGAARFVYFKESSYTRLFDLKLRTVRDLFATAPVPALLTAGGESVRVRVEGATGAYFRALDVTPLVGRTLGPDDDRAIEGNAIVLGEGAWRRVFAADPAAVGRPVRLSGHPFTIVGVVPASVHGLMAPTLVTPDVWAPLESLRPLLATSKGVLWAQVFGRLADGVSLRQAEVEIRVAGSRFDPDNPELGLAAFPVERGVASTMQHIAMGAFGTGLVALSSLVLLIACANLANLLLARSTSRTSELAVRMALGASPSRILRLQLLETLTIAALGGAGGFVIVSWVTRAVGTVPIGESPGVPVMAAPILDVRVLAFFLLMIAAVSVGIGILPATRAIRIDPVQVLASAGSRGRATGRFERMRTLLVASQVAASTVLLILAGLFVRSAVNASHYDVAFDTEHLALGHFNFQTLGWKEERGLSEQETLLAAARSIPGIRAVAVATALPAGGGGELVPIEADEANLGPREFGPPCRSVSVSPGFFDVIGPLPIRGRGFTAADNRAGSGVVIVNEVAAAHLWPAGDPLGRRLRIRKGPPLEVVGVVGETDRTTRDTAERCHVFVPMADRYTAQFVLAVAGAPPAASLLAPLRAAVARAAPDVAMFDVRTAEADLNRAGGPARSVALALVALGALGLTIALVGLYGVMTYVVSLRRAEFGVRKVLGASDTDLYRLVFGDACRMLFLGILAAVPIAFLVALAVSRTLIGVAALDATTYLLVPACLLVVGIVAAWWPARRAARVEPLVAVREL